MQRFFRYAAVGSFATLVHYLVLAFGVEKAALPAFAASGIGAVIGAQVAYAGNRWFTFAHHGDARKSWPRFQATALIGAALGMLIVGASVRMGLHYLSGQVLATLASLVLTFAINRAWTFRQAQPALVSGNNP